jgi:hypothetical protein
MVYGTKIALVLDKQEIIDLICLLKNQDLTNEVNKIIYLPIILKLELVIYNEI